MTRRKKAPAVVFSDDEIEELCDPDCPKCAAAQPTAAQVGVPRFRTMMDVVMELGAEQDQQKDAEAEKALLRLAVWLYERESKGPWSEASAASKAFAIDEAEAAVLTWKGEGS